MVCNAHSSVFAMNAHIESEREREMLLSRRFAGTIAMNTNAIAKRLEGASRSRGNPF